MTYYISRGGQQHGPYSMADLQNMLAHGQIDPNDLAWGEGLPAWTPVSQIVAPAQAPLHAQEPAPAPAQPQPQAPSQPAAAPAPSQPAAAQAPIMGQAPYSMGQAGGPSPAPSMGQPGDFRGANVSKRYKDSYRVAGVIVGLGKVLKVIGIIVAVLCLLGGVISFSAMPSMEGAGAVRAIMLIYGVFGALFSWLIFWLWGVVISAIGELLRATLDGAVHTSPFLTDDQRAEAMGV